MLLLQAVVQTWYAN